MKNRQRGLIDRSLSFSTPIKKRWPRSSFFIMRNVRLARPCNASVLFLHPWSMLNLSMCPWLSRSSFCEAFIPKRVPFPCPWISDNSYITNGSPSLVHPTSRYIHPCCAPSWCSDFPSSAALSVRVILTCRVSLWRINNSALLIVKLGWKWTVSK
jgi:hypothetical protein